MDGWEKPKALLKSIAVLAVQTRTELLAPKIDTAYRVFDSVSKNGVASVSVFSPAVVVMETELVLDDARVVVLGTLLDGMA